MAPQPDQEAHSASPPRSQPTSDGLEPVAGLSQARGVQECLQWLTREKLWVKEQHFKLCRIPAPTFQEQRRAEWMAGQFREMGCEVDIDSAGNVVARLEKERQRPFVALTAHLDTVLAPRIPEDISLGRDGRLYGPGVSDNGAGLAALLAIARAVKSSPIIEDAYADFLFIANVGEEGEGNLSGMRYLCHESGLLDKINALVVLDGPDTDSITCEALASRRFEVTFSGPGGHSWNDNGVGNPVHALGRTVAEFADNSMNGNPVAGNRWSVNFGVIDGGLSINSIPTLARAKLDIRSERGPKMDELVARLSDCVARSQEIENGRATSGKVTGRIRAVGERPGGRLAEDSRLLAILRAVDDHLGIRSRLELASTDANIPLSLGVPAVSIGAGGSGGGAHTPGEWFDPSGWDLGLKRILLTACLLIRDPEGTREPA